HIAAVAHTEQQCALGPGDPFMQLAGRMHHKTAWRHGHCPVGRAHRAAALETEIDFGRVRVAMIGARLARLPARNRHIAFGDAPEDALDMLSRIEFFFVLQVETVHSSLRQVRDHPEVSRTGPVALSPGPDRITTAEFSSTVAPW